MKQLSNEYIAGLFDGEGCIRIVKNYWTKNSRNITYSLRLSINLTDKRVPTILHKMCGGCLNIHKRPNPRHHTMYNWILSTRKAYNFLKLIEPFCIIKSEQIKIALEFQEHIYNCGRKLWNRNRCLPQEVVNFRESCYHRITKLKTQF